MVDEPQEKARAARGYKSKHKRGHLTRRDLKPGPKPAAPDIRAGTGAEPADDPKSTPLVDTGQDAGRKPPLG
ncbi:hypothetical protein [Streptomyces typhae]|uniref:hypothetical protein n=1 Tax=Streptomyces typhae TaxID=2681492 RepID=UPI0018DF5873|nr:hypothetical protein [Streptomyces typhae]